MRKTPLAGLAAVLTAVVVAAAGCGQATSSSAADDPISPNAGSTTAPDAEGLAMAKAIVAEYTKTPTTIGPLTPLTTLPPTGKTIITIANGTDSALTLNRAIAEAGAVLGWTVIDDQTAKSAEGNLAALTQAIARKPDGITISGIEPDTIRTLLEKADEAGIAIMAASTLGQPYAALKDTHIAGPATLDLWGKMIAAYAVVETQGAANVQMFTLPMYPVLMRYDASFLASLEAMCPACNAEQVPQQLADIGSRTPQNVANTLKANPLTNFVSSDFGDMFIGVPAALTTAGVEGQAAIGGLSGTKANIQNLKNGTENAWTAPPYPIEGWSLVDSFARYWTGVPFSTVPVPSQIMTQENVDSLVTDADGNYIGVADYKQQFMDLWGVK